MGGKRSSGKHYTSQGQRKSVVVPKRAVTRIKNEKGKYTTIRDEKLGTLDAQVDRILASSLREAIRQGKAQRIEKKKH